MVEFTDEEKRAIERVRAKLKSMPRPEGVTIKKSSLGKISKEKGKEVTKIKSKKKTKKKKSFLSRKVKVRRILKSSRPTIKVSLPKVENTFEDKNRFFNSEMEAAKKQMFFE